MFGIGLFQRSEAGVFCGFRTWGVPLAIIACAAGAPARAACKVAVINGGTGTSPNFGGGWCEFLNENGCECTLFSITGPTASLDPFSVILDFSQEWTDPAGLLADQLRAGKTVITWGFAPDALGIGSDAQVQAWIGATGIGHDSLKLLTVAADPIFGSLPLGSEVGDCALSLCTGLQGTEAFPDSEVLARLGAGMGLPGIHRNSWEGGRSIYLTDGFLPTPMQGQIMLRIMELYCVPIPAVSSWGLVVLFLLMGIAGCLIFRHRRSVAVCILCAGLAMTEARATEPQPSIVVIEHEGTTELALNGSNAAAFHVTDQNVRNARVVEVAGSECVISLWDELDADGIATPWYGISLDGQEVIHVSQTSNQLRLRYAQFDPSMGQPVIPLSLMADSSNEVYIVQLVAQPIEQCRSALQASGAEILAYIPGNSLVTKMDANSRQKVEALAYVRSITAFHPAYRLEEGLIAELTAGISEVGSRVYSILLWRRGENEVQSAINRVAEVGGCVRRVVPQQGLLTARLSVNQLQQIARLPEISFIDVPGQIEPAIDIARQVSGSDCVLNATGSNGSGVRGEVMDSGLRVTHAGFQHAPPIPHPENVDLGANPFHGTSVFGIIFGNGDPDGDQHPERRGILPAAQGIIATWYASDDPPDWDCQEYVRGGRFNHIAELVNPSLPYQAVFQSNSWTHIPYQTTYTVISTEMDDIAFANDLLLCQAQGNAGRCPSPPPPESPSAPIGPETLSSPEAWSKNVLSVGGFYHQDTPSHGDDLWSCGASRGPASDGRVKPDVVHFFDDVRTTSGVSDTFYTDGFGGTSAATPITCGLAGLVYQMWHEGVFKVWNGATSVPTGGGPSVFDDRPHATTVKAMLINTAYRYPLVTEPPLYRPDFTRDNMGWGMADVAALYEQRNNMFIVNETELLGLFGTSSHTYTVPTGSPALRVTMVYADPPATPCSTVHLVNDLSIKVTSPSGAVYWGNHGLVTCLSCLADYFVGNWSIMDPNPLIPKKDHINNVENVFVKNPQAGTWTIAVIAEAINQDGHLETPEFDADYALAVSSGDRPRGQCCETLCDPSYHCICSWKSRSECTGAGAVWTSDATCADDCSGLCANFCIE